MRARSANTHPHCAGHCPHGKEPGPAPGAPVSARQGQCVTGEQRSPWSRCTGGSGAGGADLATTVTQPGARAVAGLSHTWLNPQTSWVAQPLAWGKAGFHPTQLQAAVVHKPSFLRPCFPTSTRRGANCSPHHTDPGRGDSGPHRTGPGRRRHHGSQPESSSLGLRASCKTCSNRSPSCRP